MGGLNSGNRHGHPPRRLTVEGAMSISVQMIRDHFTSGTCGKLEWIAGRDKSSALYEIVWVNQLPVLILAYFRPNGEPVAMQVHMEKTLTQFGGQRWWFTCPLFSGGMPCGRRVGKIYRPPGARCFGCRKCHGLTYQSSQEAHLFERLIANESTREMTLAFLFG